MKRLSMINFPETIVSDGISIQTEQLFTGKAMMFFYLLRLCVVKRVDDDSLSENVRLCFSYKA